MLFCVSSGMETLVLLAPCTSGNYACGKTFCATRKTRGKMKPAAVTKYVFDEASGEVHIINIMCSCINSSFGYVLETGTSSTNHCTGTSVSASEMSRKVASGKWLRSSVDTLSGSGAVPNEKSR